MTFGNQIYVTLQNWESLCDDITAWGAKTFGFEAFQLRGRAVHLKKEAKELVAAIDCGQRADIENELADVFILAIQLAKMLDVKPETIVRRKFGVLQTRTWKQPDKDGVIEHVKFPPATDNCRPGGGQLELVGILDPEIGGDLDSE